MPQSRRPKKNGRPAALAATLAAALLAACGEIERPVDKAAREGILIMGNAAEPQGLDPHLVSGVLESNIIRALFEGLCVEHPSQDGVPIPGVASEWLPNDKFTAWTFHLNPEARWSDGAPVTAHDFTFGFARILTPKLGAEYSFMLYYIEGAEEMHRNRRCHAIARKAPEKIPPALWAELTAADGEEAPFTDQLDAAELEDLQAIQNDPGTFPWPEKLPPEFRDHLLGELIALRAADPGPLELFAFFEVGARAPDDHTLEVDLRGPLPFLPELTKHYTWYPIPKHLFAEGGGRWRSDDIFTQWARPGNIVSNGPFELQRWRVNSHIDVKKSPTYWDADKVKLNGVRYLALSDYYTENRMFKEGQIHITYTIPVEMMAASKRRFPQSLRSDLYLGTYFMRCNTTRPPFDDVRIRKAFSLAIDREKITTHTLQNTKITATGLVPPSDAYQSPGGIGFDPQAARELLAEAGFEDPNRFPPVSFLTTDRDAAKQLAEALQGEWKQNLGVEVKIRQMEWGTYLNTMFSLQYDLAAGGWIGDYLDPTTFLDMWLEDGGNNRTGWSDPQYEALLRKAEAEADPARRVATLQEAETLFLDQRPVIPIYWYITNYLIDPRVRGWDPLLLNNHPYKFISINPTAKP